VIANCPSCGTHYKHQSPVVPLRARCGRCDTTLDLTRFRPYKIVSETAPTRADAESAANYLPIGLDHPNLATTIATNVAEPGAAEWQAVPAATGETAETQTAASEPVAAEAESGRNENVTFWLWTATAAVLGTAASWTMSGTTLEGLAPGALIGAVAWWGWRRWISPR
jgi:hypothetical protein